MLVLSRKSSEKVVICVDHDLVLTVHLRKIRGKFVTLAFDAPPNVRIFRSEVWDRIERDAEELASRSVRAEN